MLTDTGNGESRAVVLQLPSNHLQAIQRHAEQAYPQECCGLLLGHLDRTVPDETRRVQEIWPAQNAWTPDLASEMAAESTAAASVAFDSTRRYWIDPQELLAAQKYGRDRQLDIIGVYHSHPDHPAIPSECDRTWAWPHYSYLIVSVQQGQAQDSRSWSLDEQQHFQPEPILSLAFQVSEMRDRAP